MKQTLILAGLHAPDQRLRFLCRACTPTREPTVRYCNKHVPSRNTLLLWSDRQHILDRELSLPLHCNRISGIVEKVNTVPCTSRTSNALEQQPCSPKSQCISSVKCYHLPPCLFKCLETLSFQLPSLQISTKSLDQSLLQRKKRKGSRRSSVRWSE